MTDRIEALKELAQRAEAHSDNIGEGWYGEAELRSLLLSSEHDAAFIAACDPPTILKLVAVVEKAREMEKALSEYGTYPGPVYRALNPLRDAISALDDRETA